MPLREEPLSTLPAPLPASLRRCCSPWPESCCWVGISPYRHQPCFLHADAIDCSRSAQQAGQNSRSKSLRHRKTPKTQFWMAVQGSP